jgi:hypothetical protein
MSAEQLAKDYAADKEVLKKKFGVSGALIVTGEIAGREEKEGYVLLLLNIATPTRVGFFCLSSERDHINPQIKPGMQVKAYCEYGAAGSEIRLDSPLFIYDSD